MQNPYLLATNLKRFKESSANLLKLSFILLKSIAHHVITLPSVHNKLLAYEVDYPTLFSPINTKDPSRITRSHFSFPIPISSSNYYLQYSPLYRITRLSNEDNPPPPTNNFV